MMPCTDKYPSMYRKLNRQLIRAVISKNLPRICALVAAGADIHLKVKGRRGVKINLVYLATTYCSAELLDCLLYCGADIDARISLFGATSLFVAIIAKDNIPGARLLLERGADPEARLSEWSDTLLHWAAYDGLFKAVNLLLEFGANARLTNDEGETPLDLAVRNGHDDVAMLLRDYIRATDANPEPSL